MKYELYNLISVILAYAGIHALYFGYLDQGYHTTGMTGTKYYIQ